MCGEVNLILWQFMAATLVITTNAVIVRKQAQKGKLREQLEEVRNSGKTTNEESSPQEP